MINLPAIWDFIKKNFLIAIVIVLSILLFIERCSQPKPDVPQPTIKHDTTYVKKDSIIHTKPKVIKVAGQSTIDTIYLPNPNYDKLLIQYRNLLTLYFNKNISSDTLKLDKYGKVFVLDTITKNVISGRTFTYHLNIPEVTTTITLPPKLVNQVYIGGSLEGTAASPVHQITGGFLFKNKKDQIFGAYTGIDFSGQIVYGVQSYWKIKL